jgi:hypothetical protein
MSEGKKNIKHQTVETVESTPDGEWSKTTTVQSTAFEAEPAYVKLYLADIGKLKGLNQSEGDLMKELVRNMGYNNMIPLYKPIKELIAKKIPMNYNTLEAAIKKLKEKGVLIPKARGIYIMDPNIFGRGKWKDIKKIRMTVDYHEDGTKSINAETSTQLGLNI